MSPRLRTEILFLLFVGLLSGCNRQPPAEPAAQREDFFKTHFQDESQFIVETILTDLAEMSTYAASNRLPAEVSVAASEQPNSPFRMPAYDVKLAFGKQLMLEQVLRVNQPIWAPELYGDFTKNLVGTPPASVNQQDRNDLSVLLALVDLRAATIEHENERISGELETHFNDPTLHEMAAVILGALRCGNSPETFMMSGCRFVA